MKPRLIIILFLFFTLSTSAQVTVTGEVMHLDKPVSRVYVEVYTEGKRQLDEVTNARGNYEVSLPFGVEAKLVFKKRNMLPISVLVDTKPKGNTALTSSDYVVPFNVEVFYTYASLGRNSILTEPIGTLTMIGEKEETFQFVPDETVLAAIKAYKESSLKMEAEDTERAVDYTKPKATVSAAQPAAAVNQKEKLRMEDSIAEAEQERIDETVESSKRLEEDYKKARSENQKQVEERKEQFSVKEKGKEDLVDDNKDLKSTIIIDSQIHQAQMGLIAAKKSEYDERMAAHSSAYEPVKDIVTSKTILVKKEEESNMLFQETTFLLKEGGILNTYIHTVYDWWFFTTEAYYRNDTAITKLEYENKTAAFN